MAYEEIYVKPKNGIPASDLANNIIPTDEEKKQWSEKADASLSNLDESGLAKFRAENLPYRDGETESSVAEGLNGLKNDLANKIPKSDYTPEGKTDAMTQPVGKDSDGKLWTAPGGHWETIYEYVSDNIVVSDFSITYDEENGYSILTVPDGVLSEFNVGDLVRLAIFPLDGTTVWSDKYLTGSQYQTQLWRGPVTLSEVEIKLSGNMSVITPSNAVVEIMHGVRPKIFEDKIEFNPTSKLRYTGINTGGDTSLYTFPLFYNLRYMGNRSVGYTHIRTRHMNLIANLEVVNGLLLFHHTLSFDALSQTSTYHNKWTDMDIVGYVDASTSYITDGKLTSIVLGSIWGTPMFPRKGGFIRIEGWYE